MSALKRRQETVIALTMNKQNIFELKNGLKYLKDLEVVAVKFVHRISNLDLVQIKSYVLHIAKLFKLLKTLSNF